MVALTPTLTLRPAEYVVAQHFSTASTARTASSPQVTFPLCSACRQALDERRSVLSESDWWSRYGPVWVTIEYEVLPKFTPGQVSHAELIKPADALLDLVEHPWDIP